jgi:hypothetical protein
MNAPRPVLVRPRPGSSTGKSVSSAKIRIELMTCRCSKRQSGSSHQQARPTQSQNVERSSAKQTWVWHQRA